MKYLSLFLIFAFFIVSCAPKSSSVLSLHNVLDDKRTISLPMRISEKGLILLDNIRVGETEYTFLLDTGATHSAIYENALKRSGLNVHSDTNTVVHGMVKSEELQTVKVHNLELGSLRYLRKSLIVLPNREVGFETSVDVEGIIGMDILSLYQIYVSPNSPDLKLIPNDIPISIPPSWDRIELIANPFKNDNRNLHFIELRVTGKKRTALVDTGAEFSVMNWKSAQYQQVKLIKRRLRKEWELQGAIGTFTPVSKVRLEVIRSGQKFWSDKDFVVMDFNSLETLVSTDAPFLIVGMNLFKDETFLIDFDRNYVSIKPKM